MWHVTVCNSHCIATLSPALVMSPAFLNLCFHQRCANLLLLYHVPGAGERTECWRAHLPRMHRGLGSIPGTANKTKRNRLKAQVVEIINVERESPERALLETLSHDWFGPLALPAVVRQLITEEEHMTEWNHSTHGQEVKQKQKDRHQGLILPFKGPLPIT